MPALKMKTKPSTGYLREGKSLHVCHKTNKVSKGSHFKVKVSQQAAVPDSVQESSDVSSNVEVSDVCVKPTEAIDHHRDSCAGASDQISDLPSGSPDSASAGRNVPQPATCPSILETIFSPILEHDEVQTEPTSDMDAAPDDEQADLPHLVTDESDDGSCSPSEYQSCSVSDYCISDLGDPALSFDGSMGFSDLINSASPDYDHINSELMFDMGDRYMMFPYNESNLENNDIHDDLSEEAAVNVDEQYLYLAIHQLKSPEKENEISFNSDVEEYLDPLLFISKEVPVWPIRLPKETQKRKHVTLVLDLDETLVHSTLEHCDNADFTFPVFFNMKEHTVYVKQRPYLHVFLERVAQMFEIVIFTASQSIYAEQLLDILDPTKKLISQRIYRESCIFSEGSYTKDLTILGVDLTKVAIIDNSPQVFRLQVNNGIPIKSWFDDPSDCALISLLPFLETLVEADDVRPIIAKRFNNKEQ